MSWAKKKVLSASRDPNFPGTDLTMRGNESESGNVVFYAGNMLDSDSEMLKITKDGFYVRGVKVEQSDKEAETVYNAFAAWLTYHSLVKDYQC
jgi:hypothetical protein